MSSVSGIAFAGDTKRHEDDPSAMGIASLFHLAAANEGVLIGPGGVMAVSTAHDAEAMAHAIGALSRALETLRDHLAAGTAAGA
jgi:glutamate-1-semialdehyde aminotransferase